MMLVRHLWGEVLSPSPRTNNSTCIVWQMVGVAGFCVGFLEFYASRLGTAGGTGVWCFVGKLERILTLSARDIALWGDSEHDLILRYSTGLNTCQSHFEVYLTYMTL